MERPLYLGIDLGTTNSAACVFDGDRLDSVRGASGETLTPSVVRMDARGGMTVGKRAHRHLLKDPANTRGEFKRLMGSQNRCHFAAADVTKAPEELAAQVLLSLRRDVEGQFGVTPSCAVIAVPALFELPQIQATSEAARLAGFDRVETIQEPVASALASGWSTEESQGAWLVYDLGGGTFDVSLLETREGLLRVAGHDGDNFLGGRDFDLALVDWLIPRLAEATGVLLQRSNPEHRGALAQLKVLAEEAKIELSRGARETTLVAEELVIGNARLASFEAVLNAADLDAIVAPLVDRSVRVCQRLIRAQGVDKVERIVLVGGPTMMPVVRTRLQQALGAPLGTGLDPMLLVAQGAALFAATASLDARGKRSEGTSGGPRLWLQYPAMTPDASPFVVGRSLDAGTPLSGVRFSRSDETWQSEWLPLETDGTFSGMLSLRPRASTTFRVEAQLADHQMVIPEPSAITVVHGVSVGEPPLARTIGVARADDSVAVYFERGSPLPLRKTFTLRTIENIAPSATEYALRVPLVQGDFPFAHLCRLVGVIQIPAARLGAPLPAGSLIELTLEVNRGGALSACALIPSQNLSFDHVESLVAPAMSPETMSALLRQLESRAAALRLDGFRQKQTGSLTTLADFDATLSDIRRDLAAVQGGDADAAEKARRALIDCDGILGDLESAHAWPELAEKVIQAQTSALYWVGHYGTDTERALVSQCIDAAERALRARNPKEVDRQLEHLQRIRQTAYLRHPQAWSHHLDSCAEDVAISTDPKRAQTLVLQGRAAEKAGNKAELERIVRELWHLFPADKETRSLSFDSGVK